MTSPAPPFDTIPAIRPLPELGVPDPLELVAHHIAEHDPDSEIIDSPDIHTDDLGWRETVGHALAFGGVDVCETWPTSEQLADARSRIPDGCGL